MGFSRSMMKKVRKMGGVRKTPAQATSSPSKPIGGGSVMGAAASLASKRSAPPAHAALEPTGAQTTNYVDQPSRGGGVVRAAASRANHRTIEPQGIQTSNYNDEGPMAIARKSMFRGLW